MSNICLTTGLECIKCNPGPCEHRGSSINENLNTCPCCDNKVEYHPKSIHMNNFWNKHTIVCPNCGLKMEGENATVLFKNWNTRKPIERIAGCVEEKLNTEEMHWYNPCDQENWYDNGRYEGIKEVIDMIKKEGKLNE